MTRVRRPRRVPFPERGIGAFPFSGASVAETQPLAATQMDGRIEISCAAVRETYLPMRAPALKPAAAGVKRSAAAGPSIDSVRPLCCHRRAPMPARIGLRDLIILRTVAVVVVSGLSGILSAREKASDIVTAVEIQGNRVLSNGDVRRLMNTRANPWYGTFSGAKMRRYDARVFRSDVNRIAARYRDLGHFDAVVDTVVERYREGFVRVRIRIREGNPVVISGVRLEGLPAVSPRDSLRLMNGLTTTPDRPLTRMGREADLKLISDWLQDGGYAFAKVEAAVSRRADRAIVTFRAAPGPRCRFGQVRIEGNRRVSDGLILRGLTFREGDPYRKKDLLNSRLQLHRSEAFRSVSVGLPDTAAAKSPVDVRVVVRERPARSLKLGAGYDTEERIRGLLAWRHRSFLGGDARQLTIESSASALEARAMVGVRQPYILGSRTWLHLTGFVEQERPKEVRVKRGGATAAIERTFRATGRVLIEARTEVVDFELDSTRATLTVEYLEDRRDDYFDPQRGLLAELAVKAAGNGEFLKASGEGRWYRRLFWKCVLALRVSGGMILNERTFGSIPNFERFFAGGANSVRGWRLNRLGARDANEEPSGGRSALEGSIEVRARLLPGFGVAAFLDAGNVGSDRFGAFDPGRLRLAAGGGFRYLNPISPVRLDFAYRLSEDPGEPRRRIHFSLGQAF